MSVNDTRIPENYEELKKEYIFLRKENDVIKQELHGSKRQIQLFEALNIDYQSEIDLLQSKENDEKHTLEEKILSLEDSNNTFKIKYREERQSLENRILELEEENEHLKTEIDFLKNTDVSSTSKYNTNSFTEDIIDLKEENDTLLYRLDEMQMSLENLQEIKLQLEEKIQENTKEISELKDNLVCKQEALSDVNNLNQKLSDEMVCLKNELESYKSQPLDKLSKGNSLFAEVDDRRVYLQKTIDNMKSEFIAMKQERTRNLNTIHHLKLENIMFLEKWRTDINDKQDDTHTVIKAYKNQVKTLEKLIENYKKDLVDKSIIFSKEESFKAFEYYNVMLNNKTKEIEEFKEQLASQTLTETLLSQALKQANEEKRNWRLEACLQRKQLEIKLEKDRLDNIDKNRERILSVNSRNDNAQKSEIEFEKKHRSDVITIDDTSEDEDIKEVFDTKIKTEKVDSVIVRAEEKTTVKSKCKTIPVKSELLEPTSIKDESNKENETQDFEEAAVVKKVTFASHSQSPKKSNLRKCKKVIICKPMSFSSIKQSK